MSGARLDNDTAHNRQEEEEDEEVSDNPLPAWMEGDSLAPPCQADMDVVRAIIDFAGVTQDDVSLCSARLARSSVAVRIPAAVCTLFFTFLFSW